MHVITDINKKNIFDEMTNQHHDLINAFRSLDTMVRVINAGYRFDDTDAQERIDAIANAVNILRKNFKPLIDLSQKGLHS